MSEWILSVLCVAAAGSLTHPAIRTQEPKDAMRKAERFQGTNGNGPYCESVCVCVFKGHGSLICIWTCNRCFHRANELLIVWRNIIRRIGSNRFNWILYQTFWISNIEYWIFLNVWWVSQTAENALPYKFDRINSHKCGCYSLRCTQPKHYIQWIIVQFDFSSWTQHQYDNLPKVMTLTPKTLRYRLSLLTAETVDGTRLILDKVTYSVPTQGSSTSQSVKRHSFEAIWSYKHVFMHEKRQCWRFMRIYRHV